MASNDLGIPESELYGSVVGGSLASQSSEIRYPSFTLRKSQVEKAGLGDAEFGDTGTATISFKVKSVSARDDGKEIELQITSIDDVADEPHEGEDEEEFEDAGGIKVRKRKETGISAKDIIED